MNVTKKWHQNRFQTSRRGFLGKSMGAAALGAFWSEETIQDRKSVV